MQELDQLISTLASAAQSGSGAGDAIDRELAAPRRTTKVASLVDSPEVEAFRTELTDGLIRVDTANQFLRLVNQVITQLLL